MSEAIKLEIFDRKTGDRRVEEATLPVEIGKSPSGASQIVLAADRSTISRAHGRIEFQNGELIYVDKSSNGTTVAGQRLQGRACRLNAGDLILIEDYEIRLVGQDAMILKVTDTSLAPLSDIRATSGDTCLLCRENDRVVLRARATYQGSEDAVIAEFSSDGAAFWVEVNADAAVPETKINNRNVSFPARANAGDVVSIGGNRIEVLRSGVEKIICGNSACHLLNDLPFEENCVWCGYYLAASGSFTRVTPP